MEANNQGPSETTPAAPQSENPADNQTAEAVATQEGASTMAEKKTRKKDETTVVIRISGDAAVALNAAVEAATKKSGFKPRASQVVEAALLAYAK